MLDVLWDLVKCALWTVAAFFTVLGLIIASCLISLYDWSTEHRRRATRIRR
jgi:hypothetical protein